MSEPRWLIAHYNHLCDYSVNGAPDPRLQWVTYDQLLEEIHLSVKTVNAIHKHLLL